MRIDPVQRLFETLVYEDTKLSPAVAAASTGNRNFMGLSITFRSQAYRGS